MNTLDILHHLNDLLPLKARQNALAKEDAALHRSILRSFAERGKPRQRIEKGGRAEIAAALQRLRNSDLVVLDGQGDIIGAYPFTLEETPHRLTVNGHRVHAMCALDALAVSPMFDCEVRIDSSCALSGEPIHIQQRDGVLLHVEPSENLQLGIHWQSVATCAAHSLCREMVFLKDPDTAMAWQQAEPETRERVELRQAIRVAARFFTPLMQESTA
ncbi:hypothetical protein C2E25_07145 [Geothermobacter hydrogeniphilus]|uniref:Alkylmercury lyase n=1 Tax=Geothermobacter hydrogeniphilus TaxID=1969733 RepID=A0A2K2HB47_9BACT|nr:alkylmercury lyase family protein [Geothermobacter hydrogeniphilus]PNU20487.1 hypothetical protein C2E25_07145 [Geothermobacter hydrogeniphilus]